MEGGCLDVIEDVPDDLRDKRYEGVFIFEGQGFWFIFLG